MPRLLVCHFVPYIVAKQGAAAPFDIGFQIIFTFIATKVNKYFFFCLTGRVTIYMRFGTFFTFSLEVRNIFSSIKAR